MKTDCRTDSNLQLLKIISFVSLKGLIFMKYTINMVSSADTVKGQGVGSAYEEQVKLVKEG